MLFLNLAEDLEATERTLCHPQWSQVAVAIGGEIVKARKGAFGLAQHIAAPRGTEVIAYATTLDTPRVRETWDRFQEARTTYLASSDPVALTASPFHSSVRELRSAIKQARINMGLPGDDDTDY
jgi:hypothetical protein